MEDQEQSNVPLRTLSSPPSSHHSSTPTIRKTRNEHAPWLRHRPMHTSNILLLIFLACFISLSSASNVYFDEQMIEAEDLEDVSELFGSTLARLARSGTILVDQRPPPIPNDWNREPLADDLKRRNAASTPASSSAAVKTSSTSTLASTSSSSGLVVAATPTSTALPTPLDVGFTNNVTTGCNAFMNYMLSNSTFKSCLPFSLLIEYSNSFFQASKSVTTITEILDTTCKADVLTCTPVMTAFAKNITTSSACSSDLALENPLITYAHLALLAYKPLYQATCLRNPETSSYCFADAITNASSPADSYIYFLPLNTSLVGGSQPTCSTCLKNTMAVFEQATSDRSSALASTYVSAAMQVNVNCGPSFTNSSLAAAVVSGAQYSVAPMMSNTALFALVLVIASWLI